MKYEKLSSIFHQNGKISKKKGEKLFSTMSNSSSQNPKSTSSSMDEVEKALGELELLDKQQRHEEDLEKVICSAKKALDMLLSDEKDYYASSAPLAHQRSLYIAASLNVLGYACMNLKRYDESLKYFNWSNRKLNELLEDGIGGSTSISPDVLDRLIQTHAGLFDVKMAMGRKEDAPPHMKKVVEFMEKTLEEGCVGLGQAYKDLYEAYLQFHDYEEALPYCLKALDIYTRHMGEDSKEVALIRRDLGVIYAELEEYDLALEHNMLATSVLESDGGQGQLMSEIMKGYILGQSGRHEQAVSALKVVISRGVDKLDDVGRVMVFNGMALALCGQEKFREARKYMDASRKILDKEEMESSMVATGFGDLALLYKKINDFKTAMCLWKKVLKTPELRKDLLLRYYKSFYELVYKTNKEEEEFPYLEDAVERLKRSFGPKHVQIGYGYCDLGVACMKLHKRHEAVKYYESSKEILDAELGPRHTHSLKISQTLSTAYAVTGRRDLAIPCQEKVVEGMRAAGPSEQENLSEAVGLLIALQFGI